jgi:hypothetical protein
MGSSLGPLRNGDIDALVGPVLKRDGGYAFDTWTSREGLLYGHPYRRIEDAIYARRATVAGDASGLIACSTLDEFATQIAPSAGWSATGRRSALEDRAL